MSDSRLFSVKMRASRGCEHVSGAERIVTPSATPETASALVRRALGHSKGDPDFISLKVAAIGDALRIKALPVATETAATPSEGLTIAERLLREAGVHRAHEVVAMFADAGPMRGAMLVDADTLERLEPDKARGVRATCMDAAGAQGRLPPSSKSHYAEAIVLASKVARTHLRLPRNRRRSVEYDPLSGGDARACRRHPHARRKCAGESPRRNKAGT